MITFDSRDINRIFVTSICYTMERFFPLSHLTTEQLCDMYRDACKVGSKTVRYDKPLEQEYYDISLPDEVILQNIRGGYKSYIVYHQNFEG